MNTRLQRDGLYWNSETGVNSFIVNQDGQIYQKDPGPQTARLAAAISAFDPDPTWQAVQP